MRIFNENTNRTYEVICAVVLINEYGECAFAKFTDYFFLLINKDL